MGNEKIKVLYIADIYEIGGAVLSFGDMISTLSDRFGVVPVVLASKDGKNKQLCGEKGYKCVVTGHRQFYINAGSTIPRKIIRIVFRPLLYCRYVLSNIRAINIAEKEIDFDSIDIIHTNTERNDIGAYLAKKHNIPHIWHLRVFGDKDYECFSLKKNLIDFMNSNTDKFIMISKAVAEHWISKGLESSKVKVIYNGINTGMISTRETILNTEKLKIVMVGFIAPLKGQIELLEAVAELDKDYANRLEIDFYGRGAVEYLMYLKAFIKKHRLSHIVSFKGQVSGIGKVLCNYDVGCTCSRAEGFGRVTAEYMASGLCVVASDTGANPELVVDGLNGFIYRYGDIKMLKSILMKLIDDRDIIEGVSKTNIETARKKYSIEENAKNVYALYRETIKSSGKNI